MSDVVAPRALVISPSLLPSGLFPMPMSPTEIGAARERSGEIDRTASSPSRRSRRREEVRDVVVVTAAAAKPNARNRPRRRRLKRRTAFLAAFEDSPLVSHVKSFDACMEYWDTKHLIEAHALETGLRSSFGPMGFAGLACYKACGLDFNACTKEWQSHQSRVFRMVVNAMIKKILGRDIDCCLESVMAENNWTKIEDEVMMLAYRGSGKTWMLSAAVATFFYNIPDLKVCAYAAIKEKTVDFFENIYMYFDAICERHMEAGSGPKFLIRKEKMRLFAYVNQTDRRWIKAYSTRGFVRFSS